MQFHWIPEKVFIFLFLNLLFCCSFVVNFSDTGGCKFHFAWDCIGASCAYVNKQEETVFYLPISK